MELDVDAPSELTVPALIHVCDRKLDTLLDIIFRGSIVVSIPACHAGDPGSIPGRGVFSAFSSMDPVPTRCLGSTDDEA